MVDDARQDPGREPTEQQQFFWPAAPEQLPPQSPEPAPGPVPTGVPPMTMPSAPPPLTTAPPWTTPPYTPQPPITQPPITQPPITQPPITQPPAPMSSDPQPPQWYPAGGESQAPWSQSPPTWYPAGGESQPPWSQFPPQLPDETVSAVAETADVRPPGAHRRRPIVRLVIEIVVVALVGTAGYLFGVHHHSGQPAPIPRVEPPPSPRPYEASQVALNRAKFSGDLVPLAEPWLAEMGRCRADTDPEGPHLQRGETKRVFCRVGGVSVHFALFTSAQALSEGRAFREGLYRRFGALAPGAGQPGRRTGGVSDAQGDYVEYALKDPGDGRPLCGIWWHRDNSQAALMLEALCQEDLGGSWAPLRDLWQRYS